MDVDSFWEYSDPAGSEARFRAALESAKGDERLELVTQVARTYSLRKDFAKAHALLDEVEAALPRAGMRPRLRYLLERGRSFNSAGEKERAREHFQQAWALGSESGEEGLAVDAAHMVAITFQGAPEAIVWNVRGLDLARDSKAAKAQALIPAMHNNMAWDLHDLGRHEEALRAFETALEEWSARGRPRQIQVAKWSVAQCLRSLGRDDEAQVIEKALDAEGFKP
jgi:tetratricopeptide (TPR) repeat protein